MPRVDHRFAFLRIVSDAKLWYLIRYWRTFCELHSNHRRRHYRQH